MFKQICDYIENCLRAFIIFITNYLPVKVIRDDNGTPFLYRYHIFKWGNDGPGLCFHRFVLSDPERGFHSHPWDHSVSFILCGGYQERILKNNTTANNYFTVDRPRWTFNYLSGKIYHRVMVPEGKDVWTLFVFGPRRKTWEMIYLEGKSIPMSTTVSDKDGKWHESAKQGSSTHSHLDLPGKVIATVDIVIVAENKVLLIKRGKEPFKGFWAFPGGRIEQKDSDIITAAYRELKEETNLENIDLKYIATIGNNSRDPRGFCLTNVFLCRLNELPKGTKAGDDAIDYKWFETDDLPDMAFDHKEILENINL